MNKIQKNMICLIDHISDLDTDGIGSSIEYILDKYDHPNAIALSYDDLNQKVIDLFESLSESDKKAIIGFIVDREERAMNAWADELMEAKV